MDENNEKSTGIKNAAIIRIILCLISLVFIILSWLDLIPETAGIIGASVFLIAVSLWNAIESLKAQKKVSTILEFVMAGILTAICIIVLIF